MVKETEIHTYTLFDFMAKNVADYNKLYIFFLKTLNDYVLNKDGDLIRLPSGFRLKFDNDF